MEVKKRRQQIVASKVKMKLENWRNKSRLQRVHDLQCLEDKLVTVRDLGLHGLAGMLSKVVDSLSLDVLSEEPRPDRVDEARYFIDEFIENC